MNLQSLLVFLVFIFLYLGSSAQADINMYTDEVPTKIRKYHEAMERSLLDGKVDTARTVFEKMVEDIDTTDDIHLQAWTWYHYGDVLSYSEKYVKSNEAYEIAIKKTLSSAKPDVIILIRANNNIGYNLTEMGQRDQAFDYNLKAYQYLAYAPPEENRSNIIYNLALDLKSKGELGLAGKYMEQVIEEDKKKKDSLSLGYDYQFLAEVYRIQKNIPKAVREFNQALRITPEQHLDRYAMYHNGIGSSYLLGDQLDSAMYHIQIAEDFARKSDYKNIIAAILVNKSDICLKREDQICAQVALQESGLLAEKLNATDLLARVKLRKSRFLSPTKQKAELHKVIEESTKNEWHDITMTAYKNMFDLSNISTKEKITLLTDYNQILKDRIARDAGEEAERLNARMALIESEQKIRDLQRARDIAEKEARTEKMIRLILSALVLISIAGLILVYQTFKQKRKLSEANYRNQISVKINEVNALQSRLSAIVDEKKEVLTLPSLSDLNDIIDNPLTEKEYEILLDVSQGMTNKEIATKQFISSNTVKFHLKNIFSKLDVNNRKEAIRMVLS